VNYALMTWRTEARQPAGSEGSISPLRLVARAQVGNSANCFQPAKANKD
jgi:hypothetical protein